MDPVALRRKNFIPPQKFPYASPLGWSYDSGDYDAAMKVALDTIGYDALAHEKIFRHLGAPGAQGQIVFGGADVIAVAFNFDLSRRVRFHPFGVFLKHFLGISNEINAVEFIINVLERGSGGGHSRDSAAQRFHSGWGSDGKDVRRRRQRWWRGK